MYATVVRANSENRWCLNADPNAEHEEPKPPAPAITDEESPQKRNCQRGDLKMDGVNFHDGRGGQAVSSITANPASLRYRNSKGDMSYREY